MKGNLVFKYCVRDIIRSRWLSAYILIIAAIGFILQYLDADFAKLTLSLSNIVIYLAPLITILYSTIYFYNSQNFIELLLTMPVKRAEIIRGLYSGIAVSLSFGLLVGINAPALYRAAQNIGSADNMLSLVLLNLTGVSLTFVFTGLALLIALSNDNRLKGFGYSFFIYIIFAILYDSILLSIIVVFKQYPIDNFILVSTAINPVDLSRTLFTLNFDSPAVLGHSGALFRNIFGTNKSIAITSAILIIYIVIPFFALLYKFKNKDF